MRRSVGQATDGITTRTDDSQSSKSMQGTRSSHWVNTVMVARGEILVVFKTYYRVRDKSAPFQKRPSVALEPRFP